MLRRPEAKAALARQGRYIDVAGNLKVTELNGPDWLEAQYSPELGAAGITWEYALRCAW